jgi:hypothetical protein
MENLATLEPNGKTGVLPADSSLWRAFTETHEETLLRGHLNLDGFLDGAAIPTPTYPSSSPVTAAYPRRRDKREGQFCKFGESRFLRDFVDHGSLRLFAGSHYADSSLNSAVRDDELALNWWARPDNVQITLPDGTVSKPGLVRDWGGRINYDCDFYVWCLSQGLHDRLLADFDYDCFVVFYDMNEFLRSIKRAIQTVLPGWTLYFDQVSYVDPYNLPKWDEMPPMPFCKHHKYSYQHEWRIVMHPDRKIVPGFQWIDLELEIEPDILELLIP